MRAVFTIEGRRRSRRRCGCTICGGMLRVAVPIPSFAGAGRPASVFRPARAATPAPGTVPAGRFRDYRPPRACADAPGANAFAGRPTGIAGVPGRSRASRRWREPCRTSPTATPDARTDTYVPPWPPCASGVRAGQRRDARRRAAVQEFRCAARRKPIIRPATRTSRVGYAMWGLGRGRSWFPLESSTPSGRS